MLLHLGRFRDAAARAAAAAPSPRRNAIWIAATTLASNPQSAVDLSRNEFAEDEARRTILEDASWHCMEVRQYEAARALAKVAADMPGSRLGDVVALIDKLQAAASRKDDEPAALVRRLLVATSANDDIGPWTTKWFGEHVKSVFDISSLRFWRRRAMRMNPRLLRDIISAVSDFRSRARKRSASRYRSASPPLCRP